MDTFASKNKLSENAPMSSRQASRDQGNNSESTSKESNDKIDDLKYADDFLNGMNDYDEMIRNSPRLASSRPRIATIDKSKSGDRLKQPGKVGVVKGMTNTATHELKKEEKTDETSKCISNKYSRYNTDDDGIDAIAEQLINDDYSLVKCDEKRNKSRSKQYYPAIHNYKENYVQDRLDKHEPDVPKKSKTTAHDRSGALNNEDLDKDIDEIINVVDHFESDRIAKKVKKIEQSEFSNIKTIEKEIETLTDGENVGIVSKNEKNVKGKRSSRSRSKYHGHKNDKYEYADNNQFKIAPKPIEVEIEVHENKENDNTIDEPESYFQHNTNKSSKKASGCKVDGRKRIKETGATCRENVDLIEVLHEVKSDKILDDETVKKSKDADTVTKPGSIVIRVQSEHQITTRQCKDAYIEYLPGAVPQNVKNKIVKSVTIIDTGDAGVIIIKKLGRRSRLKNLFCGCFSGTCSDKSNKEFDFGEQSDSIKCYEDHGRDIDFNEDFLHFEAKVKEGCCRRLWRRLRGCV